MSLETAVARIQSFQAFLNPAPATAATPATTGGTAATGAAGTVPGLNTPASGTFGTALQGAMQQAAPGTYPNLKGDLDANPEILRRAQALAQSRGEVWNVTSGGRTYQEQAQLYAHPEGYPVARPGTSRHETGRALDVTINGRPIQSVISASVLRGAGLSPLAGDAVHVELPG
jgi:hypothetical protein